MRGYRKLILMGLVLSLMILAVGCGKGKQASTDTSAAKIDIELQAKVKAYSEGVEKPLEDLMKTLDTLETVYQDLGYQRLEKEAGRTELKKILAQVLATYDQLIEVADKSSSPEVDEIVSLVNGGIYREKESLKHVVETDLSKAELNQSLETMRDSKRQIDKGLRDLTQLKQRVGLGPQ